MTKDSALKNRNILISGASIAGPALAYWLSRHGFNPAIVERAPALREGGHAVDIRGMSRSVTERMGIMPDIRRATTGLQRMAFVNSAGKRQARMSVEDFGGEGPVSEFEIMRGDLSRILYDLSKETTEYIFNDSITSLTENDRGVYVTFERNEPRTFDLVVGADGLHSNVRALAFGDEAQFMQHLGCYLAIFTTANHPNLDREFQIYNMPGKVAGIYPIQQNRQAKAMFYFTAPPMDYNRRDIAAQKKIVAGTYAGEGWAIPQLLESMQNATDFYFDSMSLIKMDHWAKGRVVLLGDAGYSPSPLTGQGTNLALVGAYVLAGELKAAAGDYRMAFANYEKEMREYVEKNQKTAGRNGDGLMPPTRFKIWFRNTNIRMLPYMPWKGLIAKAMQVQITMPLKDYADGSATQSESGQSLAAQH